MELVSRGFTELRKQRLIKIDVTMTSSSSTPPDFGSMAASPIEVSRVPQSNR